MLQLLDVKVQLNVYYYLRQGAKISLLEEIFGRWTDTTIEFEDSDFNISINIKQVNPPIEDVALDINGKVVKLLHLMVYKYDAEGLDSINHLFINESEISYLSKLFQDGDLITK